MKYVLGLDEVGLGDVGRVGGKNASLGELVRDLRGAGVRVPGGFALTADAFRLHLDRASLTKQIYEELDRLDSRDVTALAATGRDIRALVSGAALPPEVESELVLAYAALSQQSEERATDVAVRSSATAEDLPDASFAGQQETFLNVRGRERLVASVRDCMASLFTDRAIAYRAERGFRHRDVALSVGVQKMVRSDLGSAGVIFTLDTETGFRDVVVVTAAYGLGETVVQGRVDPDEYWVHKPTLAKGFASIIRRECGSKEVKMIYAEGGTRAVEEVRVGAALRERFVLSPEQVLKLSRWAVKIEEHYSARAGRACPMDIEWALDGRTGEIFIVQARPETVHSMESTRTLEVFRRRGAGDVLARGRSVGSRVAHGKVRVVHSSAELSEFRAGEVLVAEMTDPDWEPVLARAAAVVTDHGGRTCHAAIVSRELGIPCVVGAGDATTTLKMGAEVTVSCAEGDEGRVYAGRVDFDRETIDPAAFGKPRVPVMLNVGNPETAFLVGQLPSAGVGLLRLEFVISSWIGVHPMAIARPDLVRDPAVSKEITRRARAFGSAREFFVERLAAGVGQIAAAFHPRPVTVRLSDFKTNEYATLLGGRDLEPSEANPMIGFRGASRYYDERYREGFALECEAMRRVREGMGLHNIRLMIPFCRTLREGEQVIEELAKNGLRRGDHGLEVWVMCEIPNNVVLAREFSDLFDGFSIGSNDLTQLTLGVDRDSELLAHIFDERDPGVRRMIEMVIEGAHSKGRPVGLCGQAPSDHPEFAQFLADAGIDSISVTPDALPGVLAELAAKA